MGSRGRERFERSNRQIWGDRALVRARASRGPDAIETSLKTYNPVDETLDGQLCQGDGEEGREGVAGVTG